MILWYHTQTSSFNRSFFLYRYRTICLLLHVIIQKGGSRLSTIVTIVVLGHEASNSGNRTVLSQSCDFSITFYSVILECLHGNGLVDTLYLLWLGEYLLFTLLTSTSQPENQVKSRFFLNVVVAQSTSVFKLLSGEDKTLLIRGDSLLILDLGLDIIDGIRWFDIQCDGLACWVKDGKRQG